MVLKPVGTQNTPKKQYNMDTRIAKNPSEIPQSHNDFGEFEWWNELEKSCICAGRKQICLVIGNKLATFQVSLAE